MPHEHAEGKVVQLRSSWQTEADYSPASYYTAATDAAGHNAVLPKVGVPPSLAARARELVESPLFPFATIGEVVRDAMYHRFAWVAEHHPDPESSADLAATLRELAFLQEMEEARGLGDRQMQVLTSFRTASETLLEHRDLEGLERLCDKAHRYADTAREPYSGALREAVAKVGKRARDLGIR